MTTDTHFDADDLAEYDFDYTMNENGQLTQAEIATLYTELGEAEQALVTIRDFIRFVVTKLRQYDVVVAQGTTDEFAEAAAIVLHSLSLEWSADEQILECKLTPSEKQEVLTLLSERIIQRKPLSYLINLAYFCGLPFYVDERVLIPRSPIAELINQQFYPYFDVDDVRKNSFFSHGLEESQLAAPERILDLCTGSGCIAIALAKAFPDANIDATDIDKDALEVAWTNVEHHELAHQVNLLESNLFAKLPAENQYELIVTNPPYVDAAVMADLPPEFLHEPEHALAAGQDGLDLVHQILYHAPDYLTKDGLLVCEVGDSEWALRQAYPEIQFDWLTFEKGGSGVFAITCEELLEYQEDFARQVERVQGLTH
ncbi:MULTISPECIES: 50S ribosomal protein L3 N(5)-glutamine methyltransferase [Moraxella]|uniref:Ribosomal protein uL3 glutamine methyltransferase n=1 Tax=Moraxella catarrhalis TaxID=480 RepID=A0A7Z0V087_MORCA|nr:50S ribosomal protein L3 N(5)-glutamine methyltransferase [Moraxella catarrhalis]OAV01994.1 Protein-N5-glutamine methyltransferase PrmB, methylates LSU ribosomal protein L3p [Moraxella catarrhalis]STY82099.1 50S ribosomal protein L3 glutamine methyltransferase [Moraxella catarrhalis]